MLFLAHTSAASGAHGSLGTEIRIILLPACLGFQFSFAKLWAHLMLTISSVFSLPQAASFHLGHQVTVSRSNPTRKHMGILVKV